MYERFTDRARKIMQLANQEAQRFQHEYIGTEHILLGMIKEGSGVAANVLKNLGIDLRKVRLEVEKIVQTGTGSEMVMMGKLPQTPRAKKVIEYAIQEARDLNHNYVGTEHLLLGVLREQEGVGAQVLMNLGLRLDAVRMEVLNLLGHNMPEVPARPKSIKCIPALDIYGRDLTDLAHQGQLDSEGGRAGVVTRLREHLNCLERKCLLLVTDSPFERRTALAGLAQYLVAEAVPGNGPAWHLKELNLRRMWLGISDNLKGGRDRFHTVLQELRRSERLAVYVPDLDEALAPEAPTDLAQVARVLLLEAADRLITAVAPQRFRDTIDPAAELARMVRPLLIPPPTSAELVSVLRGLRGRYGAHHRVHYADEALTAAAELSARRLPGPQPDAAMHVLDLAGARMRPPTPVPPDLKTIEEQISFLDREKEAAVAEQDFEKAAHLRDQADKLKKHRDQVVRESREQAGSVEGVVDAAAVAEIVSELAGDDPEPRPDAIR